MESCWRTIKDDLLNTGGFENLEKLHMIYYNKIKAPESLNGQTSLSTLQNLSLILEDHYNWSPRRPI